MTMALLVNPYEVPLQLVVQPAPKPILVERSFKESNFYEPLLRRLVNYTDILTKSIFISLNCYRSLNEHY